MTDYAQFQLELLDKASGPSKKITGSTHELADALGRIESKSAEVTVKATRMDRVLGALKLAYYGTGALSYGHKLVKAAGGLDQVKKVAGKAGAAIQSLGRGTLIAAKRLAPFAVGAAGIYGLGKVASSVALPALGAVSIGIGGVGLAAGAATLALGGMAVALGVSVAKTSAEYAVFGQNAKLAFNRLAKYGASGEKIFRHVGELAVELGLDVKDTTKQYTKFLGLQFSPKTADKMVKLGADMRALGASSEEVGSIWDALGKIKSKTVFQGDQLLQLELAGVSGELIWKELSHALGKTQAEARKMMSAGKIDADTALVAIEKAINQKLGQKEAGETGKQFADTTIDGMVGKMKARGQLVAVALGERLAPSLQRIASMTLGRFFDFLDSDKGTELVDKIGDAFDLAGDAVAKALPIAEAFLTGFGGEGVKIFDAFTFVLGKFAEGDGKEAAKTAERIGKGLAYVVGISAAVIGAVVGITSAVIGFTYSAIGTLTELPDKALALGKDLVRGFTDGIKAAAQWPVDAITGVADRVLGAARRIFDSHSPSREFRFLGYTAPQGLALGFRSGTGVAVAAAATMAASTVTAASSELYVGPLASAYSSGAYAGGGIGHAAAQVLRGAPVHVTFGDIIVQSPSSDPAAVARQVRREIEAYFRELDSEV
jgi:tape measure domain-containing protein